MKIITEFVYPPIPDRSSDWSAYDEDAYDCDCTETGFISRHPVGYGATASEAIEDLMEQVNANSDSHKV